MQTSDNTLTATPATMPIEKLTIIVMEPDTDSPTRTITATQGATLLDALRGAGLYLPAICGGRGTCGKCAVQVSTTQSTSPQETSMQDASKQDATMHDATNPFPVSDADRAAFTEAQLAEGYRLACTTPAVNGIRVRLVDQSGRAEQTGFDILQLYEPLTPSLCDRFANNLHSYDSSTPRYGLAVDIGTTTIAFELISLATGRRVGVYATVNRQRTLGADVITRIQLASQGKLKELYDCIRADMGEGIAAVCAHAGMPPEAVAEIVVTGNTTMLHILRQLPCESLGHFPFTPVTVAMSRHPFSALLGDDLRPVNGTVTLLPGVSAFVGADITAGILFCGGPHNEHPRLLIDLGTNGEMALFYKDTIIVTSTAAGPAFEAGNITHGTGSVPGAIAQINYHPESGVYSYETIGRQPPIGLCGTGVVDMAAQLVAHGLVDETGLLADEYFENGVIIDPQTGIGFTQKDVREIQLAKSAVRAGIEVLLAASGLRYEDIERLCLAGGFGYKINIDNAAVLGLIPVELRDKVTAVGNSALGGCVRLLTEQTAEADIRAIAEAAKEINLSADPRFNDLFMTHMMFE